MKSILYVQYTDPAGYPPLERSAWQFAELGWTVRFIGLEAQGRARHLLIAPHPRISVKLMSRPARGFLRQTSYLGFLIKCLVEIIKSRPTVVYCSEIRSYPVGLMASFCSPGATVLHEHDTPASDGSRISAGLRVLRRHFAQRASLCVLPQAERAEKFAKEVGATRICVVYNCPSLRELQTRFNPHSKTAFTIWYHGSIVPSQMPEAIIHALTKLPLDVNFDFAGYETLSSHGYVDHILALAAELGVGGRVTYRGTLPLRSDLLKAVRSADLGLALFADPFREPMAGASNKPFDYLACGVPVLTNEAQEWKAFFGDSGVSVSCNPESAEDIARAVLWFREHPEERLKMAENGIQIIKSVWNYEAQFSGVVDLLAKFGRDSRVAPSTSRNVRK